jgi:hypothetical protein
LVADQQIIATSGTTIPQQRATGHDTILLDSVRNKELILLLFVMPCWSGDQQGQRSATNIGVGGTKKQTPRQRAGSYAML